MLRALGALRACLAAGASCTRGRERSPARLMGLRRLRPRELETAELLRPLLCWTTGELHAKKRKAPAALRRGRLTPGWRQPEGRRPKPPGSHPRAAAARTRAQHLRREASVLLTVSGASTPSRTELMNYPQFKRLLHETLPAVWARRLEAEQASRRTLVPLE
jgi:hypothetical protein